MDYKTKEGLFGRLRGLPSSEPLVAECSGVTEGEFIDQVGALAVTHLLKVDEGLRIERLTRFAREVQAEGRCLSSGSGRFLSVNVKRLQDRVACRIFRTGQVQLEQEVEEAEGLLGGAPAPWARGELERHLDVVGRNVSVERVIENVEAAVERAVDNLDLGDALSDQDEMSRVVQELAEAISPEAADAVRRLVTALSGRVADVLRSGEVRRASAFLPAAEQMVEALALDCEGRASRYQQEAGERRADLRREARRSAASAPLSPNRPWHKKAKDFLLTVYTEFMREASAADEEGGERHSPRMRALRSVIRSSLAERVLRDTAREARLAMRGLGQLRRRVAAACTLGRSSLQHVLTWEATLDADNDRFPGIRLEADERVLDALAARLDAPSFTRALEAWADRIEQAEPGAFVENSEQQARRASAVYSDADLSSVFAQLPTPLQDSLINELLTQTAVPVRKADTALWDYRFVFAAPGGANSPLGRAVRRQPAAGRFSVREWKGLPDTAVAIAWVPFIRPAEMVAYEEGRRAMEELRSRCGEEQWLSLYSFALIAEEADPEASDQQVDELIVKGFAVGQIGASKWPSGPPFYLCNGHTGGRPVHVLPAQVKRLLPRLGSSVAEMRRTLLRRPEMRREVELVWRPAAS